MNSQRTHAVTGAFGYSGKYIARRLLEGGQRVITLTNSPARKSNLTGIEASALCFDNPKELSRSLEGVDVLYNTYWVRFNHRRFTHADAVANTKTLFNCAKEAGVGRIVHISITNPAHNCGLEYFEGKAELEDALQGSGIGHTILRPAVLFGKEDILINNIAWFLRKLPVFGVPGKGDYKLQPIYVDDLAALAVVSGTDTGNNIIQAIGPETFTFRQMVEMLAATLGVRCRVVGVPPAVALWTTRLYGAFLGDVIMTKEEIGGLMGNYLVVDAPPAGTTALSDWAREHAATLGKRYACELFRRNNRHADYIEKPQ